MSFLYERIWSLPLCPADVAGASPEDAGATEFSARGAASWPIKEQSWNLQFYH